MQPKKIYVASSWRNPYQQKVVAELLKLGHQPYDFRQDGFSWDKVDQDWPGWTLQQYRDGLEHRAALGGFARDFNAMVNADECLLVCPSGRSAHTEAGYMAGLGKPVVVLLIDPQEPELMYNCFDEILIGWAEFSAYYSK